MPQGAITGSVPMSKSQRNKARQEKLGHHGPHVEHAVCSACGQRANAVPGTMHAFCEGLPLYIYERQPSLKGHLKGDRKGEWVTLADYNEAMVEHDKLRKVIALFTWIAEVTAPVKEESKGGAVVEIGSLADRTKRHHPRKDVRKAA